ncbi:MAG: hypothetical protein HY537_18995 [Deltaproteobacteria bacterium]|nr:hypothetical protein [Deltaproteobacteria bacterium]
MSAYSLSVTAKAESQIATIMNDPAKAGLQKQLKKAFRLLIQNPKHPSLSSHLLKGAESAYGVKVWTSYVQNRTPQAHRILWTFGEKRLEIVILAVIPHY